MREPQYFWLLEIKNNGNPRFVGHYGEGFCVVKDWTRADRFREKHYAEKRLQDLRAMHPGLGLWEDIKIEEHGEM